MNIQALAASILASILVATACAAGPVGLTPPERVELNDHDFNGDGKISTNDYAPGTIARADGFKGLDFDINEDGKANGKDTAPGQLKK